MRVLALVGHLSARRSGLVIASFVVLALLALAATFVRLELRTDQNELVSTDAEYHQRYVDYLEAFGDQEYLYLVIEVDGDPARAARAAEEIAAELARMTEHIREVHYRVPPGAFADRFLLLPRFSHADLSAIAGAVAENRELLSSFVRAGRLSDVFALFAAQAERFGEGGDPRLAEWGERTMETLVGSLAAAARGEPRPPLLEQLETLQESEGHPRDRGYLFTENGELAFVLVMPAKDFQSLGVIRGPLAEIRGAVDRLRERYPGLEMGLTGRPVLHTDEMLTTERDMRLGTVLALVCVLSLFVLFFRRLRRPLLAGLALVVAVILTFGAVAVTIGYLTLLSIVFAAMLVGLGIDFGIHFLARYQDELRAGSDVEGAIVRSLSTTGAGIFTGGVTTAGAFYTAVLVEFKGLRELGFVAGTGVLICLGTMLVLLPALIAATDRRRAQRRRLEPARRIRVPGLVALLRFRWGVLAVLALFTGVGAYWFPGVAFNFNLLELQAEGLESVRYELLVAEKSSASTWQAVYVVDSLEEVDDVIAKLGDGRAAGVIGAVESVRDSVARDQPERRAILAPAAQLVESLPEAERAPFDRELLAEALEALLDRLDTGQSQLALSTEPGREEKIATLDRWIGDLESVIDGLENEETLARVRAYEESWLNEVAELRRSAVRILRPPELRPDDLPAVVRDRFVSESGKFVVFASPQKDIWREDNMLEFVQVTRAVRPGVTGTPIEVYESTKIMRDDFIRAALYSAALVFAFLLFDFRHVGHALLAMVPVVVGLVWLLELMPHFGLSLNLANFFALPILIGCGVDGGVHMVHRYREAPDPREVARTAASAVTLSFITTIAGFGALSIASHRGVSSLGLVMALGCITVLVATVVLLPALLPSRRA